jgi:hypothetical protein
MSYNKNLRKCVSKIFKKTGKLSPKRICVKQPTKVNLSDLYQQVIMNIQIDFNMNMHKHSNFVN